MGISRDGGGYCWVRRLAVGWTIAGLFFVVSFSRSSGPALATKSKPDPRYERGPEILAGTLRDDTGSPVADAKIKVWDSMASHWGNEHKEDEGITDANGGFRLRTGFHRTEISVESEIGTMKYAGNPYYQYVLKPLEKLERQDIVLMRWAEFTGKVVNGETGEAIEEFRVHFVSSKVHLPRKYESEEGRFTESKVTPGTVTITVMAHGYAANVIHEITAAPGSKIDIGEVRMRKGPTLKGQVFSAISGKPLAGVLVRFGRDRTRAILSYPPDDLSVTTNSQGKFSVSNAPVVPLQLYTSAEKPKHRLVRIGDVDMALARNGIVETVFYVDADAHEFKEQH
jgi:hypothetical protein